MSENKEIYEEFAETDVAEIDHEIEGWAGENEASIDTYEGSDENAFDPVTNEVAGSGVPTQIAHPAKATVRTGVAAVVAAVATGLVFAPLVIDAIVSEAVLPDEIQAALITLSGIAVTLTAIGTRIMAIPGVDKLLRKIGLGTGVEQE